MDLLSRIEDQGTREIVSSILGNIQNIDLVYQLFSKLLFEVQKEQNQNIIFTLIIVKASTVGSVDVAKMMLCEWERCVRPPDECSTVIWLSANSWFPVEALIFLLTIETIEFQEAILELCQLGEGDNVRLGLTRLLRYYGDPDSEDLIHSIRICKEQDNQAIEEELSLMLRSVNEFAPRPRWIIEMEDPESEEYLEIIDEDMEVTLPDGQEAPISELIQGIDGMKFTLDDSISLLIDTMELTGIGNIEPDEENLIKLERIITSMTQEQREEIIRPMLKTRLMLQLGQDKELFRRLGPSNPYVDTDYADSFDILKDRMFTCDKFDYDEDKGTVNNWFRGSCDSCMRRIEKKHYALRKPMLMGGWIGCYCSTECIRQLMIGSDYCCETIEIDAVTNELIKKMEQSLVEIGIYDPYEPEEIEEQEEPKDILNSLTSYILSKR